MFLFCRWIWHLQWFSLCKHLVLGSQFVHLHRKNNVVRWWWKDLHSKNWSCIMVEIWQLFVSSCYPNLRDISNLEEKFSKDRIQLNSSENFCKHRLQFSSNSSESSLRTGSNSAVTLRTYPRTGFNSAVGPRTCWRTVFNSVAPVRCLQKENLWTATMSLLWIPLVRFTSVALASYYTKYLLDFILFFIFCIAAYFTLELNHW